jgi:hypothetical protein
MTNLLPHYHELLITFFHIFSGSFPTGTVGVANIFLAKCSLFQSLMEFYLWLGLSLRIESMGKG